MGNQFLFNNAVALSLGAIFLLVVYIFILVKASNYLVIKKQASEYDEADKIAVAAVIFSALYNLSTITAPIYQILQQSKYVYQDNAFTLHIVNKTLIFGSVAALYLLLALLITSLVSKIAGRKLTATKDFEENIGDGVFFGLTLVGVTMVLNQHLGMVLSSMVQANNVPIFN